MLSGIAELGIAISIAAVLGFVARLLKQPLIIAYLATGAIITAFGLFDLLGKETFRTFSDLGIMFLLFLVGLEINYHSIKIVGRPALIVGLGQIIFTSIIGFGIARLLDFDPLTAAYIAVALTFSSTIIIVKLLSDKKDLNSLYGKISVGFLLVQDAVAILILVVLSSVETGSSSWTSIYLTLMKGIGLFWIMLWLGKRIMPKVMDYAARSPELLFLASTAWVLIIATLVNKIGFSVEIAGFLAGLALANSSETYQIANRIRPLRDFFILVFFLILGSSFVMGDFSGLSGPVIIFSLFVLIGNPLIVLVIMGLLGYKKRTGFLAGVTVAQISEFSLILAALGNKMGHIDEQAVSLITAVGIVTITLSTYLIIFADRIYRTIGRLLSIFEKKTAHDHYDSEDIRKPIVLVGYHRTGKSLVHRLSKQDILVVDFDPKIIEQLEAEKLSFIFGDISDPEVFDKTITSETKLLISTSPDTEDNLVLIERLKQMRQKIKIVVRAESDADAFLLYGAGADYVLIPNFSSGYYLGEAISSLDNLKILPQLRRRDLALLKKI